MEFVDHIIQCQWLITCEENNQVLRDHSLVIHNGCIKAIIPSSLVTSHYQSNSVHRFDKHAVMPGFINAHTHIGMNYFRGLADDLALMNWLNNYIWPAEKKWLSHEFVYDASLFAIAEMIRSGTTCFNDMFFFLEATGQAIDFSGIRGNVSIHVIDFPTNWTKNTDESLEKGLTFLTHYQHHDRITTAISPHAIYTVTEESLRKTKDIADRYHLKINMHVQETLDEINQSITQTEARPLQRLHQLGLLNPQLIAIHMTHIHEDEYELLSSTRPNIVHCPQSNMKLASGACPVTRLKSLGLNIALGTDGAASNNDLNMIEEMRSAALLAKCVTHNPESLSAEETLKLATLNGAKALGIDQITGSLTPGKAADFIAIQLENIETLPLYHPISQIVYSASRHQVTDVWVAGKPLLRARQLVTLDEKELIKKAQYWGNKIQST